VLVITNRKKNKE